MIFIDEAMGTKITEDTIRLFDNAEDVRQIEYLGVMLVDDRTEYSPDEIARYAIEQGHASKLGYLADISIQAAEKLSVGNTRRVKTLRDLLEQYKEGEYVSLFPYKNEGIQRKIKENMKSKPELRRSGWNIYTSVDSSEMDNYIELYLLDLKHERGY